MDSNKTTFEVLEEIVGKAVALNLCDQCGGQTVYIRKYGNVEDGLPAHWSEHFGKDVYERLVERLGGQRVYIPMAPPDLLLERDTAIFIRRCSGESAEDIARDYQLTPRSVHSIYCRVDRVRVDQAAQN